VHAHKRRHTPHGLFDSHSISLSPIRSSGGRIKGGSLFFFAYTIRRLFWLESLSCVVVVCGGRRRKTPKQKNQRGWKLYINEQVNRKNNLIDKTNPFGENRNGIDAIQSRKIKFNASTKSIRFSLAQFERVLRIYINITAVMNSLRDFNLKWGLKRGCFFEIIWHQPILFWEELKTKNNKVIRIE
jgi:hypothetical protein